jgi:hypothetical protein
VLELPDVTPLMAETRDHELVQLALHDCLKDISFGDYQCPRVRAELSSKLRTGRATLRALRKLADQQAQTELDPALELVEVGDVTKIDDLLSELSIAERLDGMIDRYLKRLLFVRGLKSLSSASSAPSRPTRITKAA